jgi:hypothetical protein
MSMSLSLSLSLIWKWTMASLGLFFTLLPSTRHRHKHMKLGWKHILWPQRLRAAWRTTTSYGDWKITTQPIFPKAGKENRSAVCGIISNTLRVCWTNTDNCHGAHKVSQTKLTTEFIIYSINMDNRPRLWSYGDIFYF